MKLNELLPFLAAHPDAHLRFLLAGGAAVPDHAHVTEVARFDKRFVDCGGTLRTDSFCRLQVWVADDREHRLTAGKLHGIFRKAAPVLQTEDLEVDVEHELGVISQSPLERVEVVPGALLLRLGTRHTACLAEDKCKRPSPALPAFKPEAIFFKTPANR